MIVVADTSPTLYLVLLEQVELLPSFYGAVIIPDAVASELNAMRRSSKKPSGAGCNEGSSVR